MCFAYLYDINVYTLVETTKEGGGAILFCRESIVCLVKGHRDF